MPISKVCLTYLLGSPLKELSLNVPFTESVAERCPVTRALLHSPFEVPGTRDPPPDSRFPSDIKGPLRRELPIKGPLWREIPIKGPLRREIHIKGPLRREIPISRTFLHENNKVTEFHIPVKLVMSTKLCVNNSCNEVPVRKRPSNTFPIQKMIAVMKSQ